MKRVVKYFVLCLLIALFSISLACFLRTFKHQYTAEELFNIGSLDDDFLDKYFDDYSKIASLPDEDKENVLIVTTHNLKNDYGANTVVEGPNGQFFLAYDSKEDKDKALEKFQNSRDVVSVDENGVYEVEVGGYNSWGITKTGLSVAIDESQGKSLNKVVVAVIDTGLDTSLFNSTYPGKLDGTYDVLTKSTTSMVDNHGHGTHVSGTVAEGTPDNVKLLSIRASANGTLYDSDIIAGINYAASYEDVKVINMSFGGTSSNANVNAAIQAANANNIISVAAAGNEKSSASHFPSNYDNVISISAINSSKTFDYSYSNYGKKITFAMPGTGIKSIMGKNTTLGSQCNMVGDTCSLQGTSMATPHAAAAVAILKSYNSELTYSNVMTLLLRHTEDLGDPGRDDYYGYGMINFNDAHFCENINCDEFDVFEKGEITDVQNISIDEVTLFDKNYGSEYNLYPTTIVVTHSDGSTESRELWEFTDFEISNYDPYDDSMQNVTISVLGETFTLPVTNNSTLGWTYTVSDGKAILTKFLDNVSYCDKLVFPSTIDGYQVTGIANGTLGESSLFKDSTNYTHFRKMSLPSSIITVGDYAFLGSNLHSITFDAASVSLGAGSFKDSVNLLEVNGKINAMGEEVFSGCKKFRRVTLDDSIKIIPKKAFYQDSNLLIVLFPDGLTTIGEEAFVGSGISSISIPASVNLIDPSAFIGAKDLVEILIDEENTIYNSANNANAIIETGTNTLIKGTVDTIVPEGVKKIGAKAFAYSPVENVTLPSGVTEIDDEAFYEANKLEYVVVPASVTKIGINAFKNTPESSVFPKIKAYYDSYARTFASTNKISYESLNATYISVNRNKIKFIVGETVNPAEDINYIDLYYPYGKLTSTGYSEYSDKRGIAVRHQGEITVSYKSGNALAFGDTYYTISGFGKNGEEFTTNVNVTVEKATPKYDVPTGLQGTFLAKLSTVELPDGFTWESPNSIIERCGELTFTAKFTPKNTDEYKVVEHIPITITVPNPRTEIVPNITVGDMVYDGTNNVDSSLLEISNLLSTEYTVTSISTKSVHAGETEADVTIKLTDSKYQAYSLGEGLQEYTYTVSMNILPKKITKPTQMEKTYTFNDTSQSFAMNGFDSTTMSASGNIRFNAGSQPVVVTPISSDYVWDDGSSAPVEFTFTINKAPVEYEYDASDVTLKYDGLAHSVNVSITKPTSYHLRYMNDQGNYSLTVPNSYANPGRYVYKFRIYIDDNHEDVYDEATLVILGENIEYEKETFEGFYDGNEHTLVITPSDDTAVIKYSLDGENYNLDEPPKYKNPGEYKIYYQISLEGYEDETGYETVKIYGVKSYGKYATLYKDNILVLSENEFALVINAFNVFAPDFTFRHLDNLQKEYDSQKIKTGDYIMLDFNGLLTIYYEASYIGDVNGDGKISSLDYVRIKNHIMSPNVIGGDAYLKAADANEDGKVSSLDYVRIKNWIMKGGK